MRRNKVFVLAVVTLAGCYYDDEAGKLAEGLTLGETRPGQVSAVFVHEGTPALFEAVVDPVDERMVSVRILDANHHSFASIISGAGPAEWKVNAVGGDAPSAATLQSARLGVQALQEAPIAGSVRSAFADLTTTIDSFAEVESGEPAKAGSMPYARTYRQRIYMYKKNHIFVGVEWIRWSTTCVQRHYSDNGGASWVLIWSNSYKHHYTTPLQNEGIAPYLTCYGPTKTLESALFDVRTRPACDSSYHYLSGKQCLCNGYHNNNDDTEFQMAQLKANQAFGDEHFRCDDESSDSDPPNDCTVNGDWY